MDILDLNVDSNDLLKTARMDADGNWVIKTGMRLGGDFFTDMTGVYGKTGIRAEMIGGRVVVTRESKAHADIEELLANTDT